MAEDAETKKIARLDFTIKDAEESLTRLEKHLETISKQSEDFAKNISKNLNNVNIGSTIDPSKIKTDINKVEKIINDENKKMLNNDKVYIRNSTLQHEKGIEDRLTAEKRAMLKQEEYNNKVADSTKTLYDKIANYANTYLIYQGFNVLKKGIVDVINEMVELENSMVQIDRVLNESSLDIDNYRDKLMQTAYDYANSMQNVADITLRLAQAGFDSNESLKLTEKTLLALNTAELNATQATDDMVAVMAQWGYMTGDANEEARQYGDIIDKINKVADNFPTTSADIMDALKKVSSAFNLAGANIDETIATIVAAEKASQRGGKVIGTALANIVQQIKAEKKLDLAEQLGLNFFKDAKKTEFKPIMEIFQEMSDRMAALKSQGKESSTEMQQLLELFTVFRRNIGASLLGEMEGGEESTYMKVYKTSLDSVGYSIQENAKYMATAKAAQEQFNTSVLQLKTQVWDSGVEDVYKSMLIFGKELVNNIGLLVDEFGGLPVIVGAVTLALSLLSKQMKIVSYDTTTGKAKVSGLLKDLTDGTKKFILNITNMPKSVKNTMDATTMSFGTLTTNLTKYGVALNMASLKTLALKAATIGLNLAATAAATAGIMLLTSIIQELINKEAAAIELQKKSIESTEKQINAREEEISSLTELIKTYDDLGQKTTLMPEETTQLYEIQAKIKDILGEQADTIDLINGKYDEQKEKINQLSKEKQKELLEDKKKFMEQKQNEGAEYQLPSFIQSKFGDKDYEKVIMQYGGTGLRQDWGGEASLRETLDNATLEEAIELFTKWEKNLRKIQGESRELQNTYNWVNESLNRMKDQVKDTDEATEAYYNTLAKVVYSDVFDKWAKEPVPVQTQFGNIDINREGITWDDKNLKKYREQLKELDLDLNELKGSYSNILGASNAFNTSIGEVEIAYSPMLQTDKGLVPLYQDEVNEYIQEVVKQAQEAVNNGKYSNLKDAILAIDAEGIDEFVDTEGNKIKGLIADVGDTAIQTGEQMHKNWEKLHGDTKELSKNTKETVKDTQDFYDLIKHILDLDLDDFKKMGIEFDKNDNLAKLKNDLVEMAEQNFPNFINQVSEVNAATKETDTIIGELTEKMTALQSKYTVLTTAQNELNSSGAITVSTFKNLVDNNLLEYLEVVDGQVRVNTTSMENLSEETKIAAIENLQAAASEDIHKLALGQVDSMSTTAKNAIANFGTSASNAGAKAQTAASKILELARALAEAAAANKELAGENNVSDFEAKAQSISNAYQSIARKIGTIRLSSASSSGGGSGRSSRGSSGSGSKSAEAERKKQEQEKKKQEQEKKKQEQEKKKQEQYEKRLKKFTETLDKMENKEEEWVKKQRELGQLSNSDMLYITQNRIKNYQKYLDKVKKAKWMNKEDRKKLEAKYTEEIKKLQLEYFNYLKGKLDDQTKAIEKSRDERIKILEDETERRKKLINEEADARIAALKKVSDERERDREKADYKKERQEILDEIAYWQQRTGREAVENLANAKKRLQELDKDWKEKVEDWNTEDTIKSIEEQRDAQIKSLEELEEKQKKQIQAQAQLQIDALNKEYAYKIKAFSESDKIIYNNSVIASKNLYKAYKTNFVDKIKQDLKSISNTTGEKVKTLSTTLQSKFGNIDVTREGIKWTDKNLKKYKEQLKEMGINTKDLKNSYSNILGASRAYSTGKGEVEIAYSPFLQTKKGLSLLFQDEIDEYIQEVVKQAQKAVKKGTYSNLKKAVLAIDKAGIKGYKNTEGYQIKGLIADVGNTAIKTGKQMHINAEKLLKAKLKLPMFHNGGIFTGAEEGLALLKKGEVTLKPEWSASLNRMMKYFDNVAQGKSTPISNNNIAVEGNLVNIQANVRNQSDIDAIGRKVEKILKDKFNIKK